jgi:uncharacterized membrane protein
MRKGESVTMAQRVSAIFHNRDAAERAADALVGIGADREHISMLVRGADGKTTTTPTATHTSAVGTGTGEVIEPAREVGDSGAALTTSDKGDAAKGAAIGAAAGLAAGLLALTLPGIGLVLAAGPLAMAMGAGAIAGGVYGGLRDIGIDEKYARGYEKRIHSGDVLMTAVFPMTVSEDRVLDVLSKYDAEDVSFAEDTSAARPSAATAAMGTSPVQPSTRPMD